MMPSSVGVCFSRKIGVALATSTLMACGQHAQDPSRLTMSADVTITSDPHEGLAGANLTLGSDVVATTDEAGRASVSLSGVEGDTTEITVICPAGYQAPTPIRVALRRLSPGSPAPRFEARCAPLERTVVVGVRAENGANLPVVHLGKIVGRTDASGVAHVVVHARVNEQLTFMLDTKSTERRLQPENPTLTFTMKDRDDLVVLEQKFEQEKTVLRAPSRPVGPQRL